MLGQDSRLIAVRHSGCLGCPCALPWKEPSAGEREGAPLAWEEPSASRPKAPSSSPIEGGTPSLLGVTSVSGVRPWSETAPRSCQGSMRDPGDGLGGSPERGHLALDSWGLGDRQVAQGALLVFGAPLLLLLLCAGGTAAFVPNQPAWALLGLAPLLVTAAFRRKTHSLHHSRRRNVR